MWACAAARCAQIGKLRAVRELRLAASGTKKAPAHRAKARRHWRNLVSYDASLMNFTASPKV